MQPYLPRDATEMKALTAAWVVQQDLQLCLAHEVSFYDQGQEFRFDFMALRPYHDYRLWGFEIKMNRQDFLQDKKWHHYLDYCHLFYFVCPNESIIQPNELPKEVGLLYSYQNGQPKLRAKRKAKYRPMYDEPKKLLAMSMMLLRNKIPVLNYYQKTYVGNPFAT